MNKSTTAGVLAAMLASVFALAANGAVPDCCAVSTRPSGGALRPASYAVNLPATLPATRSEGFLIFGKVAIAAEWDLRKPDLTKVVVYLSSDPALDSVSPPAQPAIVAQQDKAFVPKFLPIGRGTTVDFPNWDKFDHNVFSRSKAAPAFDLLRYPYGQSKSRVFDKTGIVQVFCNIHPEMRAIVFVTPNEYFARLDESGHFVMKGVPAGQYELNVWNERCKEVKKIVKVGSGIVLDLSVTLEENRDSAFALDPPQKKSYGIERGLSVEREHLGLPTVLDAHPSPAPPPQDGK